MLRRPLLALTALLALAACLAPTTAGAATKRCRAGQANIRVRHRHACVTVHGDPAADQAAAAMTHLRALDGKSRLRLRHHHGTRRAPKWTRSGAMRSAIAKGLKLAASIRDPRARIAAAGDPQPVHSEKPFTRDNGWHGTVTHDFTPENGDPNAPAGFGFEDREEIRATNGTETALITQDEKITIDQCPDADGTVHGTHVWRLTAKGTGPAGGGATYTRTYSEQTKTKITGHTTDDGHVRDFDLDMDYASVYQAAERDRHGTLVASDAPKVHALHFSKHGLKLLSFEEFTSGKRDSGFREILDHGFDVVGGKTSDDDFDTATRRFALAELRASNVLTSLEGAWVYNEACLKVSISSSDVSLSPTKDLLGADQEGIYAGSMSAGQQGHLNVTMTQRQGGKLAPGTYSVAIRRSSGSDAGQIAPTSGSWGAAPFGLTYTAPTTDWTETPPKEVEITIELNSHQGHALGVIHIKPAGTHYKLVYTHTSTANYSYGYGPTGAFNDRGTYSEQRDVALSASAPLTFDASNTTGTGSGALGWQRSNWLTDNDETSRSLSGADCEIDYHDQVTGTTPGTVQVKSLTLGPAGAGGRPTVAGFDVVLKDVGENWHMHETAKSGPCPVFDSDDAAGLFINQFTNFHTQAGDQVNTVPNPADASKPGVELKGTGGWQPGTGDVLATRAFQGDWFDGGPSGAPSSAVVHWTDTFALVAVH